MAKIPNWCDCDLKVTGKIKEVKLFKEFAKSGKGEELNVLDTNNFIPYPKKFKDLDDKARDHNEKAEKRSKLKGNKDKKFKLIKDGFNSGGYEWCSEKWGTKWGICNAEIDNELDDEGEGELSYNFETAWSPPSPVIVRMSKLFPLLRFELRYFEGSMGFKGLLVCEKGKVIDDKRGDYFGNRGG